MTFLDTHAVLWLYQKKLDQFSEEGLKRLETDALYISPMVGLELEYLNEINRISVGAKEILPYLREKIGLEPDGVSFLPIAEKAGTLKWTRDPFDRIICAQADFYSAPLMTRDRCLLNNYIRAFW